MVPPPPRGGGPLCFKLLNPQIIIIILTFCLKFKAQRISVEADLKQLIDFT